MIKLIKKRWGIVSICSTLLMVGLGLFFFIYGKGTKDIVVAHPSYCGQLENSIRDIYKKMYELYRNDGISHEQSCANAQSSLEHILITRNGYEAHCGVPTDRF